MQWFSIRGLIEEVLTVWDVRLDIDAEMEESIYDFLETSPQE